MPIPLKYRIAWRYKKQLWRHRKEIGALRKAWIYRNELLAGAVLGLDLALFRTASHARKPATATPAAPR